jgi:hypothetical protein
MDIIGERYVCGLEQELIDVKAYVVKLEAQIRRWEDKEVNRAVCCSYYEDRCKELEALLAHECSMGCGECDNCASHNELPTEERIRWMQRLDMALGSMNSPPTLTRKQQAEAASIKALTVAIEEDAFGDDPDMETDRA